VVLPTDIQRAVHFNFKLANYERFTGRKLAARLFAKAPEAAEQGKLGGQLIVATSQASWFVHWTTQAKFSGQSTVAPSHDGSPAQSIAQIVLPS